MNPQKISVVPNYPNITLGITSPQTGFVGCAGKNLSQSFAFPFFLRIFVGGYDSNFQGTSQSLYKG